MVMRGISVDTVSSELACPNCGSPMVRRRRRSDGAEFWGCPNYPTCRGTRDLAAIQTTRAAPPAPPAPPPTGPDWRDPAWARAQAGASARAAHERRSARHRERVRAARPRILAGAAALVVIGLILVAIGSTWVFLGWVIVGLAVVSAVGQLFVAPDHVRAWETGAGGELRTWELLEPLLGAGFVVLNDRRVPRSKANIDHIVIGPTGVWVVETKSYSGDVRVRGEELFVGGRRKNQFLDQALREAAAVQGAGGGVPVTAILCFHRADMPFRSPALRGVHVVGSQGLRRRIEEAPVVLAADEIQRLAVSLNERLPPAVA